MPQAPQARPTAGCDKRANFLTSDETYRLAWDSISPARKAFIARVFDQWDTLQSQGRINAPPFDKLRPPMTSRGLGETYDLRARFEQECGRQQLRRDPANFFWAKEAEILQRANGQGEIRVSHTSTKLLAWVWKEITSEPDVLWCAILGMQLFQ